MLRTDRGGFALLDSLIALLLLATVGLGLIGNATQRVDAMRRARAHDAELAEAESLLAHVETLTYDELTRMVGRRERGGFRLVISKVRHDLFVVEVGNTLRDPLLRTAILRIAPRNDANR